MVRDRLLAARATFGRWLTVVGVLAVLGPLPHGAASAAGGPAAMALPLAVITNQGSDDVALVGLGAFTLQARVRVGHAPAGVAVDTPGRRAFISNAEGRSVSVVDLVGGRLLATVELGAGPVGIAYDPGRQRVYVADWYRDSLWVLTDDLRVLAEVNVGRAPAGVEVSADGRRIYVANRDSDSVSVVDSESLQQTTEVPVGSHPFGLRLAPDGLSLWVTNVQSHDVSVIDTQSGTVVATIGVGQRPYCVAFAAGRAFVSNQYSDSVSVIDTTHLRLEQTVAGIVYPEGIDSHGDEVLVVSWMDEELVALGASDLRIVRKVSLGTNPRGFGRFVLAE